MKKLILYNIAVLIILAIILEIISFFLALNYELTHTSENVFKYLYKHYFGKEEYRFYDLDLKDNRPISGKTFKKKPILLFGCSVTYGFKLSNEENFSGILSKLTKRCKLYFLAALS